MIIYLDFLPPPRRGNHVNSDNTHTIIQHTHLSPYTWYLRLFSVVEPFLQFIPTASCNGIQPLQVITTRAREGGPKEHRANSVRYMWLSQIHVHRGSPLFPICRAASTVIPLLPKATFTPSIQPNFGLHRTRLQLTSAINILLAVR